VATSGLLDKRLVVVTGKGGVGKTTVAAALGLLGARHGKRTIVAEVSAQDRLGELFGRSGADHRERELAPGLAGLSIEPERAKEEWLRHQLRSETLASMLGGSRLFQYLTAAAPGVDELVTIGRIWELAQLDRRIGDLRTYDLAIVDAPATGHGVALLRAPLTFANVARVGPIHRQAQRIHEFLSDRSVTGVVGVALPEEMPVNETIDLDGLLRQELGMEIDEVVVNALLPDRFDTGEVERLEASGAPAAAVALGEHTRAGAQREQVARLREGLDAPLRTLPFLPEPDLRREQLELLADELDQQL
jgi:anion-transporting  ArsA/GET3 family ATPase